MRVSADRPAVVLLDMDGPLADFDRHFWGRFQHFGFDVDGFEQQRHRYFTDHMVDPVQRAVARGVVDSSGWFRALPVTAGAQRGVDGLLSAGHDVWVCTKPLDENLTCRDEKYAWLREHFPMLASKMIVASDKSMVRGDVLLDDAPAVEWLRSGRSVWRPVIFTAPFNGVGSLWEGVPHWTWGDPLEDLVGAVPV